MTRGAARRRIVRGPMSCLVGVVALIVSLGVAETIVERRSRQPVSKGALPRGFPLVVFARSSAAAKHTAHFVSAEHLERFLAEHEDHSFLMPEGGGKELFEPLRSPDARFTEGQFVSSFDAKHLGPGRQLVTVNAPWSSDDVNEGRYEATDKDFAPRDLRRSGRAEHSVVVLLTVLLTFATVAFAAVAEWAWVRTRGPRASG
jgi:hypothetical protein